VTEQTPAPPLPPGWHSREEWQYWQDEARREARWVGPLPPLAGAIGVGLAAFIFFRHYEDAVERACIFLLGALGGALLGSAVCSSGRSWCRGPTGGLTVGPGPRD
jgi:hypothetical protein